MNVDGVKITWVSADDVQDQRSRPGFVDVCMYGSISPERNETGSIAVSATGRPKLHESGLWVIPIRALERIFVVEPE